MKKITRRNFLIASGKTVGTLVAASAFMGCASPEQAENCFPRSAMPVRTDDRLTAIDDIVENYMGQGYFPGATIVVARGGKIVYEKAYGYAMLNDMGVRLDDPRPMQMDIMFDMASCTKIMATTQSIMKLYSEGKIDLNATVASYIPEFAKNGKENVTVHQLLTHTSGLPQWKAMFLYIEKDKAKVLDYICNCELMFAPGEEKYSDLGFQMLGFLVERITGRSMDEYVKNEIYKPLGLKRTTYLPLANGFTTEDVAATSFGNPYEYAMVDEIDYPGFGYDCTADLDAFRTFTGWRNYTLQGECNDGNAWMANGGVAGHAGLYSDAEDLAVLCQAMLNGGIYKGVRLYKKEVIDEFTSEQNGKPSRGLGFERGSSFMGRGDRHYDAFGHAGFTGTHVVMNKTNKTTVIFLTNKQNVGFKPNSTSYYSPYSCCGEICELVWNIFGTEAPAETLADKIGTWL